jgi:hypothetical protein
VQIKAAKVRGRSEARLRSFGRSNPPVRIVSPYLLGFVQLEDRVVMGRPESALVLRLTAWQIGKLMQAGSTPYVVYFESWRKGQNNIYPYSVRSSEFH